MGLTRNQVCPRGHPGFESLPLRQTAKALNQCIFPTASRFPYAITYARIANLRWTAVGTGRGCSHRLRMRRAVAWRFAGGGTPRPPPLAACWRRAHRHRPGNAPRHLASGCAVRRRDGTRSHQRNPPRRRRYIDLGHGAAGATASTAVSHRRSNGPGAMRIEATPRPCRTPDAAASPAGAVLRRRPAGR